MYVTSQVKKILFTFFAVFFFLTSWSLFLPSQARVYAQTPAPTLDPTMQDGNWLPDADVTFQGKTASRSALLMNLVLTNYQWVNTGVNGDAPLINFWTKIRNIVYSILLLVLLAAAFAIIISGGKSLTAWMFARRFIIMIILIWFSYALCRFLYEFVDILIGFFNRNPDGVIITSKDLFNMSFNYDDFLGLRRFGPTYNESAFVSLLLVRLTAITYYVMAGILLVRKIILWFFIAVSPIYPLLLFHFPIRNTAKIWIGEFFRWLLYAPLFFIFLSSLVIIWRNNINLFPFDFTNKLLVYPTAINILLGGPGQQLDIKNSVNYNDTFAQYVIALIMLWIVIFLPFILLRIFLDYLWSLNLDKGNTLGYIQNFVKRVPGNQFLFPAPPVVPAPVPPGPPPGTRPTGMAKPILYGTTGTARELPFGNKLERTIGQSTVIQKPVNTTVQTQTISNIQVHVPAFKSEKTSTETMKIANIAVPRMRDIARFEASNISSHSRVSASSQIIRNTDVSRMHETLQKIANPSSITNTAERTQFTQMREKLIQQSQKGEPLATSILHAANNVSKVTVTQTQQQAITEVRQTLQKISNPESITNIAEKQQFVSLKNQLMQATKKGDTYATTMINTANRIANLATQNTQQASVEMKQTLEKIAKPDAITNASERQHFTQLRTQLIEQSKKGDTVAASILAATDKLTQDKDTSITASLPQTNQVQTVNLEDYEEVKKTWLENYKKMDVPKTADATERSRKQWIENDASRLTKTIDLLSSTDQQKVDEGMKEVSSLLPFLLIGGFSQTEVVAYLQAKKHAADEALTELKETESEEDTLVDSRRKETQASKHLAASATISRVNITTDDDDADSDNPLSALVSNYSQRIKSIKQVPQLKSEQSSLSTMKLVHFPIPTMRDVARYESARYVSEDNLRQEVTQVNQMLEKLANPQTISSPEEKQQYMLMRQQLIVSGQNGDPLANSILFAVHSLSQVTAFSQSNQQSQKTVHRMQQLFHNLAAPDQIQNESEKSQFVSTRNQLIKQQQQGDIYAVTMLEIADKLSTKNQEEETAYLQETLLKIANPSVVQNEQEKQQYTLFKQQLVTQHDPLAVSLSQAAAEINSIHQIQSFNLSQMYQQQWQQVSQNLIQTLQKLNNPQLIATDAEKQEFLHAKEALTAASTAGDMYATTILTLSTVVSQAISANEPQPIAKIQQILEKIANPESIPDAQQRQQMQSIRETLMKEKLKSDIIALPITNAVENISMLHALHSPIVLPQTNQVQTVNLDDYEEIRRMWHDIYKTSAIPSSSDNPDASRTVWIQGDIKKLDQTILLLKSENQQDVAEGMKEVGTLLPFLLIGGFSQTEVAAYLQAKKQAADDVIRELADHENEEETSLAAQTKKPTEEIRQMQEQSENTPDEKNTSDKKNSEVKE